MTEPRRLSPFAFSGNKGREDGDFRPVVMPLDVDMEDLEEVAGDPKDSYVPESAPFLPPRESSGQQQISMPEGLEDLELESNISDPATTVSAEKASTPDKANASFTPPSLPVQKSGPSKPPARG